MSAPVIHVAGPPHVCERRYRQLCTRCGEELAGFDIDHPPDVAGSDFTPHWWAIGSNVGHSGHGWWITREEPTCEVAP